MRWIVRHRLTVLLGVLLAASAVGNAIQAARAHATGAVLRSVEEMVLEAADRAHREDKLSRGAPISDGEPAFNDIAVQLNSSERRWVVTYSTRPIPGASYRAAYSYMIRPAYRGEWSFRSGGTL